MISYVYHSWKSFLRGRISVELLWSYILGNHLLEQQKMPLGKVNFYARPQRFLNPWKEKNRDQIKTLFRLGIYYILGNGFQSVLGFIFFVNFSMHLPMKFIICGNAVFAFPGTPFLRSRVSRFARSRNLIIHISGLRKNTFSEVDRLHKQLLKNMIPEKVAPQKLRTKPPP